jgi:hypothetical protein
MVVLTLQLAVMETAFRDFRCGDGDVFYGFTPLRAALGLCPPPRRANGEK